MAEGDLMPYDLIVVKDLTEKFEHIIEKERIQNSPNILSSLTVPHCDGGGLHNELLLSGELMTLNPNKSIIKIIKKTLIESLRSEEMMN